MKIQSIFIQDNTETNRGACGFVCFQNKEDARKAYDELKPLTKKFRGNIIYANLRNTIDDRSVIIYELKK